MRRGWSGPGFAVILSIFLSAGCTPAPKETFRLVPVAPEGGRVEIVDARGYTVAVSHQDHSDVSVFGIVHENCIVFWIRYENYFDRPVEIDPGLIGVTTVDSKGRKKEMAVLAQDAKGSAAEVLKTLESGLAGVYQMLTGGAGKADSDTKLAELKTIWSENTGEYQSLRPLLLKRMPLQVNETGDGYIVTQYIPGQRYILRIPLSGETHPFELVPVRKNKPPSA